MLEEVRKAASKKILFLPHALRQMHRIERLISAAEVYKVIFEGEVIEHYPNDPRGPSCLVLGKGSEGRTIHVVCAPKQDYLAVITAYLPLKEEWDEQLRERRKPL